MAKLIIIVLEPAITKKFSSKVSPGGSKKNPIITNVTIIIITRVNEIVYLKICLIVGLILVIPKIKKLIPKRRKKLPKGAKKPFVWYKKALSPLVMINEKLVRTLFSEKTIKPMKTDCTPFPPIW